MTLLYFVRHCKPDNTNYDDRERPLTAEGMEDSEKVMQFLQNKDIDQFISSPYKRSCDTIKKAAEYFKKEIVTDERLRERKSGMNGNNFEMFKRRWNDKDYAEEGGESIHSVQKRNIEAVNEILDKYKNKRIVVGTHGTALSSIINYYKKEFGCDDFLKIINYMPYILKLEFEDHTFIKATEELIIEKTYE